MTMDTSEQKLWKVLGYILEALESLPQEQEITTSFDRRPREYVGISSAGKAPRYQCWSHKGVISKDMMARSQLTVDIGHMCEEYLTVALNQGTDKIHVKNRNITVQLKIPKIPTPITGHLDWILEIDGETWLLDVKSVDHNGFIFADPLNLEKNGQHPETGKYKNYFGYRVWKPRNYVFDLWSTWRADIFKDSYIHQLHGYQWALEQEGIDVDHTAILGVSKNSGHLSLGALNLNTQRKRQIRKEIRHNYQEAFSTPDPLTHPPCYDNVVGEDMAKACQYCKFMDHCFDYEVTIHPKGFPIMTVTKLK